MLLQAFCTNIWQLLVVFLPLVVGLTTKNVVLSAAITKTVSDADTGESTSVTRGGRREMCYLMTHSKQFIYGYMVLDIW